LALYDAGMMPERRAGRHRLTVPARDAVSIRSATDRDNKLDATA
jgi:hypothetical protein